MILLVLVFLLIALSEEQSREDVFRTWDKDRNGYLSQDELKAAFARFDNNTDGNVTQTEYINVIAPKNPCLDLEYIFDVLDTDDDNSLTDNDFFDMFNLMDLDSDRRISIDEQENYMTEVYNTTYSTKPNCVTPLDCAEND